MDARLSTAVQQALSAPDPGSGTPSPVIRELSAPFPEAEEGTLPCKLEEGSHSDDPDLSAAPADAPDF